MHLVHKPAPQPDGFGFIYGTVHDEAGNTWRVNIMPPKAHWRGDLPLTGFEPHETDWVIYIDGAEVARVQSHAAITPAVTTAITKLKSPA